MNESSASPIVASVVPRSEPSSLFSDGGSPARWPKLESPPVRWRELLAVVLMVATADLTLFRGNGLAGWAALLAVAPWLFVLGSPRPSFRAATWIVGAMVLLEAARLVWCGDALGAAAGLILLAALATALVGRTPRVFDVGLCAAQSLAAGGMGLGVYIRSAGKLGRPLRRRSVLGIGLPLAAVLVFGTIFVLANPDVSRWVGETLRQVMRSLGDWLRDVVPTPLEIVFWMVVAWLTIGLLRPIVHWRPAAPAGSRTAAPSAPVASHGSLFAPLRNTLLAVIVLFAVYLVFEFQTLWFRPFPKGFYYAGYAHEGAAWLTVALALATAVLSLVFRGRTLADPRLPQLKRLAWAWSAENLILVLAVFHRLFIYIDFNGMTQLRMVGLFGVATVAVGFVLVVWRIVHGHGFLWLLDRHLWTVALAVYLYTITPVDAIVYRYNVARVLDGDLAPSVQISTHPINAEGYLVLSPLLKSSDPIIREGIRSMLAAKAVELQEQAQNNARFGWTAYQEADRQLREHLDAIRPDWVAYANRADREAARKAFDTYAYQWY